MIRIMILDDDEMYLKKEKDITEQYFAETARRIRSWISSFGMV